jgi:hypothetical protein
LLKRQRQVNRSGHQDIRQVTGAQLADRDGKIMIPLGGYLIMAGIALVVAITGWGGYGAHLAAQKGYPGWKGAFTGLAGPKGIALIRSLPDKRQAP